MSDARDDFSPLLRSVMARCNYRVVGEAELADICAGQPLAMLFLSGDHWRVAESDDVAAILPELDGAMGGHVVPLIAARADERALQRRFRFARYPALVFLRLGDYLGAIEGIRDWADYMREIPEILEREPSVPPAFRLPAGCGTDAVH
ncbi:hydrogenase-1 expression HyaE [Nitrospirillum viridazoti]|uniref:Hydrogenase-1 expression HyaE n=1 Tax=Nitrospirillum viridazoti CBAmc TaxID=1441467 RepID=A0A248JUH0_9PROT|nr:hydrogenase-1 expression HyaE [Nitrospirillum amazonense]ASG22363.1 hydrogenase-1 expression HyaE [Nitrospirillum amazonense CBAmc]TWB43106.1 hydrogenase-1 operon protein HyaE [Nitrospirillum amazonense]